MPSSKLLDNNIDLCIVSDHFSVDDCGYVICRIEYSTYDKSHGEVEIVDNKCIGVLYITLESDTPDSTAKASWVAMITRTLQDVALPEPVYFRGTIVLSDHDLRLDMIKRELVYQCKSCSLEGLIVVDHERQEDESNDSPETPQSIRKSIHITRIYYDYQNTKEDPHPVYEVKVKLLDDKTCRFIKTAVIRIHVKYDNNDGLLKAKTETVFINGVRSDNSIFDSSEYEIVLLGFDGPSDLKRMLVEPIVDRYLEKYNRRFEVYHKILHAEITT